MSGTQIHLNELTLKFTTGFELKIKKKPVSLGTPTSQSEKAEVLTGSHDQKFGLTFRFHPFFFLTFKSYLFVCYVFIFDCAGS